MRSASKELLKIRSYLRVCLSKSYSNYVNVIKPLTACVECAFVQSGCVNKSMRFTLGLFEECFVEWKKKRYLIQVFSRYELDVEI